MDPDFSERQYELAINYELILDLGALMVQPLPVVPTTVEEAKQGWDAKFDLGTGYWYFLQYKVAVRAGRRTGWNSHFWDVHRHPYFRFTLLANSDQQCHQHELLTELRLRYPGVYYCVPTFVSEADFWAHARSRSVFDASFLIDIADVALSDYNAPHQVSYDDTGLVVAWSEPGKRSESNRSSRGRRATENLRTVDSDSFAGLLVDAVQILDESGTQPPGEERGMDRLVTRVPEAARERANVVLEETDLEGQRTGLANALSESELAATAGRILGLDFGLSLFIEPADSHRETRDRASDVEHR